MPNPLPNRPSALLGLLAAALVLVWAGNRLDARTLVFVVNDAGDAIDSTPGDGICRTAGGVCTLRAAVMEANRTSQSAIDLRSVPGGVVTLAIPASGGDDE